MAYDLATGNEKWKWTGDGTGLRLAGSAHRGRHQGDRCGNGREHRGPRRRRRQAPLGDALRRRCVVQRRTPIVDGQTVIYSGAGTRHEGREAREAGRRARGEGTLEQPEQLPSSSTRRSSRTACSTASSQRQRTVLHQRPRRQDRLDRTRVQRRRTRRPRGYGSSWTPAPSCWH